MASPFSHNMLWTWDSRMRWIPPLRKSDMPDMARPDSRFGYQYDERFFIQNYKALIDAVSQWPEVPYIIIWGLLRDAHGGVRAAREVARYAEDHGVGILAGVGTSGYGGVYYEGDHEYNADVLLDRRPDLAVRNKQHVGSSIVSRGTTLNPVHPDVISWIQEGIDWLFETFPIRGVNLEIGDLFVGDDPEAARQRAEILHVQDDFFQALAAHYRLVVPGLIGKWPDRLFTFATYSDCGQNVLRRNRGFLDYLPKELACQWTLSEAVESDGAEIGEPGRIHTGYSHLFCDANATHNLDLTADIAKMCRIALRRGLDGVIIYGEQPAHTPLGALNYGAFRRFSRDPEEALDTAGEKENLISAPV
jgi:hypothetical protein